MVRSEVDDARALVFGDDGCRDIGIGTMIWISVLGLGDCRKEGDILLVPLEWNCESVEIALVLRYVIANVEAT